MTARRRWLTIALPVALLLFGGVTSLQPLFREGFDAADDLLRLPFILGALSVAAALALMSGHRIGWLLALSIVGWHLAGSLALWWVGEPQYLTMAIVAACGALLTSPEMQAAYEDPVPA
jgi:hypothetical protein